MDLSALTEPKIYARADWTGPEVHRIGIGVVSVFSAKAPGIDDTNEDAAAVIPIEERGGVLVVADGCGGLPSGEVAAFLAVEQVVESVVRELEEGHGLEEGDSLRSAILDGIERAHEAVAALGTGSATTIAVAEVLDGIVRTYHVGDSPILLTGQRGVLKLYTMAHSPVGYALEAGVIDEEDATEHEERHFVSNLLGTENMRIEIGSPMPLAARDTLLLASDGVSDNLTQSDVVDLIRKGPLKAVTEEIVKRCHARMEGDRPDDVTLVLFRLKRR
jgi:serine/threonine protein phosphatase PrpC